MNLKKLAEAHPFDECPCFLGEGPMWDENRQSCFWTDIEGFGFYERAWNSQSAIFHKTPFRVSLIVKSSQGDLLLGVQGGLARYDLNRRKFHWMMDLEKEHPNHRCNDGAVDSRGRLWIGTMDRNFKPGEGSLYCIGQPGEINRKLGGTTISNGLAWSRDRRRLYFIDSPTQKVQSFFYEEASGNIEFEKEVIRIPISLGTPDGMAVDVEGMLWIAHWGGWGIYRWNPDSGQLMGIIPLPVPNVSSCAFIGPDLDQLLITTARQDLEPAELEKFPQSGNLFLARPGVKGMAGHTCRF